MSERFSSPKISEIRSNLSQKLASVSAWLTELKPTIDSRAYAILMATVLVPLVAACGAEGSSNTSSGGSTITVPAGVNVRDSAGGEGMDGEWYGGEVGRGPATIYNASSKNGAMVDGDGDGDSSRTWWCGVLVQGGGKVCVADDVLH